LTYVESELIDLDKIVRLAQRARSTGDGDSKRRLHKLLQGCREAGLVCEIVISELAPTSCD
jgi:hypothetical protein